MLVIQVLGLELKSASEKMREKLAQTRLDFQRAEGDTGSPEVQGAAFQRVQFYYPTITNTKTASSGNVLNSNRRPVACMAEGYNTLLD